MNKDKYSEERINKLVEGGASTRFGAPGGPDPREARKESKPWSVRNSIRYLAAQRIDPTDSKAITKLLPKNPTISQLGAANILTKFIKADMRAVEYVTDQIDGKLAQPNINADLAAIQEMSDVELYEQFKQIQAAIESLAIDSNGAESGFGDTAEDGSEESAQNEDEQDGATGDPEGV